MSQLPQLASQVVDALTQQAQAGPKRANLTSAIMTAFRPYVEAVVTGTPPKARRDAQDRRERAWLVSLEFWTGPPGAPDTKVAESNGREVGEERARYGGDVVTGLDSAAALVEEYAIAVGAPLKTYGVAPMALALSRLRPTISRQNGHATMRRTSACGRWHLIADIFREDVIPKEQGQ